MASQVGADMSDQAIEPDMPPVSIAASDTLPPAVVTRRALLAGGAALLAAGTAQFMQPRAERAAGTDKLGLLIPSQIGGWKVAATAGLVDASADDTKAADGYDQLVTRLYAGEGLPEMMLLVAYGSTQGGSLQLHRPETCYPGQGFRLDQFHEGSARFGNSKPIATRTFTARRDDRIERVTYWTRIGDDFPRSTAGEYGAILRSVVAGFVPDGILVRFSTIGSDIAASDKAIAAFSATMVAGLPPAGAKLLLDR